MHIYVHAVLHVRVKSFFSFASLSSLQSSKMRVCVQGRSQGGSPPFSRENATRVLCTMINLSRNKLLLTFLREICCQYR